MTKLDEARLVANCRCYGNGKVIGRPPTMRGNLFLDWACRYEYWNKPRQGHLIAASLMLDGEWAPPPLSDF